MASITKKTIYTISITEQTLRELNEALDNALKETKDVKIGQITVKSPFSDTGFLISLGECESMGYSLESVIPYRRPGKIIKD